jgi:hypothetical protein
MEAAIVSRPCDLSIRARINLTDRLVTEARQLVGHTAVLDTDMRAVMAASATIIRHSRYLAPRRVSGGSDLTLIMDVISGTPLCVDCIADKTGILPVHVNQLLRRTSAIVRLRVGTRRCGACAAVKTTFSIASKNGES